MGKIGAPYGNKNAAGGHKKSGGGGLITTHLSF